jgi:hypothetical protein
VRFIDVFRSRSWRQRARLATVGASLAAVTACALRPEPPAPTPPPVQARPTPGVRSVLPAPTATVSNWREYQLRAARRIVSANPDISYLGEVQQPLLAIPVLEIELKADGSIARIDVVRYPRQAKDTTQVAIDAVRRAAPFGDVGRLAKPWKFTETFLFNDDRQFKPRSLDD